MNIHEYLSLLTTCRQRGDAVSPLGGHDAPRALVFGPELGQDAPLQAGQAFMGHGHLFASDVRGRLFHCYSAAFKLEHRRW